MNIAYRRMSGKIGLSDFEAGTRGMWWEKRKALLKILRTRGHVVDLISPLTKFSGAGFGRPYSPAVHELLMIEFGSSNINFYGPALAETAKLFQQHQGPVVFLCDDPDLPFHAWGTDRRSNVFQWLNCTLPAPLKSPDWVINLDMPFSALQSPSRNALRPAQPGDGIAQAVNGELAYIGRPGGRTKAIKALLAEKIPFVAYANAKEWKGFDVEVRPAPAQVDRAAFYAEQLGCLALADSKHKRFGWRTGRAYHAALAGCPVLGESDHPGFKDFALFSEPLQVLRAIDLFKAQRATIVKTQLAFITNDLRIAEETFVRCDL